MQDIVWYIDYSIGLSLYNWDVHTTAKQLGWQSEPAESGYINKWGNIEFKYWISKKKKKEKRKKKDSKLRQWAGRAKHWADQSRFP